MVNGKAAVVEEFALHRVGPEGTESVFSDYTAVLKGDEEQDFLRKLFLKPFASMAETSQLHPPGEPGVQRAARTLRGP